MNAEEAMEEASPAASTAKCEMYSGMPSNQYPGIHQRSKKGDFEGAYKTIGLSSALPAICGRVCPQETQCEGKCIRGIKGESVSSVNWRDLLRTTLWNMTLNRLSRRKTDTKEIAVIGFRPGRPDMRRRP